LVRAYLLYSEAAARDSRNPSYRANRDALASIAKLLTKADVETADVSADISAAVKSAETAPQNAEAEPPVEPASERLWERDERLQPVPHIKADASKHDFDIRGDEKFLFEQVTAAYGVRAIWDTELSAQPSIRFQIAGVDFHAAMEALTVATNTFVFPITEHMVFFAPDTEAKRNELEPSILLTFPLPDSLDERDLIEAANAVRGVLGLRSVGWDSFSRTVLVRDHVSRARAARSLLESVLLPKAQLSIEVQFVTLDSDRSYQYGASLPTAFQLIDFGHIGAFKSILPTLSSPVSFVALGSGATLFGIGLTSASLFATYSNSFSQALYDATVSVQDGQTVNFHIGDKYPIPQSLYTGFQQSSASIYNPVGEITLEDLGLILKLTPRLNGDGDISLDVEASVKSLGTQTFNTVPAIAEREFKGSVMLRETQWAVIAGLDEKTVTIAKSGFPGLSRIPGLNWIFSETTRDTQISHTLLLIKPTITRLPMSEADGPEYFLGTSRGERVLL